MFRVQRKFVRLLIDFLDDGVMCNIVGGSEMVLTSFGNSLFIISSTIILLVEDIFNGQIIYYEINVGLAIAV